MKYVGKYGEYRVLACLLERDVEAYQAINANQPDFDLTAILSPNEVVRIQVKSTMLNNKSTNNSIARIDKEYDFLVVVIIDHNKSARFFVMSKAEAIEAKGTSRQLGTTQLKNNMSQIKDALLPHEGRWDKIKNWL